MSLTAALNWKPFCLHPLQWVICTTFIKASFTCLWCIYCHIIKVQIIICQVKGQCFQAFIVDMVSVSFSMISRKHFIIWRLNWLILTWKVMIQCVSLAQQICSSAMSLAGGCGTELKAFLSTPPAMSNSYNLHKGLFHLLMMHILPHHQSADHNMSGQRSMLSSIYCWYGLCLFFNDITQTLYYMKAELADPHLESNDSMCEPCTADLQQCNVTGWRLWHWIESLFVHAPCNE